MKLNNWLYISAILFTSYFWMQVSQTVGMRYYLFWVLIHLILLSPVLAYEHLIDRISNRNKRMIAWGLGFVGAPLVLYFLLMLLGRLTDFDSIYDFNLLKRLDIVLLESYAVSMGVFLLVRLSERRSSGFVSFRWIRKMSVFTFAMIGVSLLALVLPLISTDFQNMASGASWSKLIWIYLRSVLQIFLIYGIYYIFYYLNHQFLFKKIYAKLGSVAYLLSLVGLLFGLTPLVNIYISVFPVIYELRVHPLGTGLNLFSEVNYVFPILVLVISFPVILVIEWNRKNLELKTLEKEKSLAELSLLKQQINPHFFFNTLNNLYALSLEKDDAAPDLILKLSQLMRYVIYKGKKDLVTLNDEVQYLEDYIDLQKLRVKQPLDVLFSVKPFEAKLEVPPLLLIILVENAFKHGIEPSEKGGYVHLDLEVKDELLIFSCINSIDSDADKISQGGIGLSNLRERLNILFPDKYNLLLEKDQENFVAKLEVEL